MTTTRLTFLLDVDNTLLDNDAAKAAIAAGLDGLLGRERAERFWQHYEEVRRDEGMVNVPLTLAVSDRVYIMEKGVVRHEGTAAALRADDAVIHQYLGV